MPKAATSGLADAQYAEFDPWFHVESKGKTTHLMQQSKCLFSESRKVSPQVVKNVM
jgi:hypothetical protein